MKRDTIFSAIAYGTNPPVTGVSKKPHWAENVLVRAGMDSERIDSKRRSGLAHVTGDREIQRLWPGMIRSDRSRSPDIRGLLPVRRR